MNDFEINTHDIKFNISPFKAFIKKRANGRLPYDYLVPAGPYQEQWDWDAFFMGVGLSSEISSEAIYLRNWVLNFLYNAKTDGKVAGCLTAKGFDERLNHMKPFLAQGAFLAGKFLRDYDWLKKSWTKMKKIVLYRERHLWSKKYDLGVWYDSMESGADNNIAALDYPKGTVIAADLNTFIYREYKAMCLLAKIFCRKKDEIYFRKRAEAIKKNLNQYLWNKEDKIYYNLNSKNGEQIQRVSYSCFIPLWDKMAAQELGSAMIKRYLISPKYMWSDYGIRTLAKNDPDYNNRNIIKPYSNWQGPVWPIANYIYLHGLLNYGFQKEAIVLAQKIEKLVLEDIKTSGGMHENYDAETGNPLAAPNFVSWNILIGNMFEEATANFNPFIIAIA
jgi:alpha,alpha-trehalase